MKAIFRLRKRSRRVAWNHTVTWELSLVFVIPNCCFLMGIETLVNFENGGKSPVIFLHWSIRILALPGHVDHNVTYTSMGSKIPSMTKSTYRRIFTLKVWFSPE